jgi:glucose-1-phosphatase
MWRGHGRKSVGHPLGCKLQRGKIIMNYPLIIFDLGGVVVDVESDRLVHQVSQLLGRSFDDIHQAVYHEDLMLPFELGKLSAQEYYGGLKKQIELPWAYEQFVTAWNGIFSPKEDVIAVMQRLSQRHKIIALSNTNELHLTCIQRTIPHLRIIQDWIASCDVGLRKPDPEIYQLALKRSKMMPREAVYIDDRPELVEAGRQVGLHAIRFESGQQLESDLQSIGLLR